MKEVKIEEDLEAYFQGHTMLTNKLNLPKSETGVEPIPPGELWKAASDASKVIDLYTKEVLRLNPNFKYNLTDYFLCFKKVMDSVTTTEKNEKTEKDNETEKENERIKLMMFLMMTGLPKFDYETYGFKCQDTQTINHDLGKENCQSEFKDNLEKKGEEKEVSESIFGKNDEVSKECNLNVPIKTSNTEKESFEEKSPSKSVQNEDRSRAIRKPGRPKKRKYYFSKKA